MGKFVKYTPGDIEVTHDLYTRFHSISINRQINELRQKIDTCDDAQHRAVLGRQLARLQYALKKHES